MSDFILFLDTGFMWAHRKGQSRDEWIYTLAKMMEDFCQGVGVKLKLFHTGRRTTVGERVVDALSKGDMKEVEQEMPGAVDVSRRKSVVLDRWLNYPRVDRDLASRVLREVSTKVEVHIGRDYAMEMQELLREGRLKEEEG